eukprot:Phypoly_transcript_13512.p1 GENE.Phypoly_transcript_13512~~Phypoly_transcript_13512.p1  ORF type:complete len:321 (+),score=22.47 Phypoly_transcript_13512:32-964(+)
MNVFKSEYKDRVPGRYLWQMIEGTGLEKVALQFDFTKYFSNFLTRLPFHSNLRTLHLTGGAQPDSEALQRIFTSFVDCPIENLTLVCLSKEECKVIVSKCKRLKKLHLSSVSFDTQRVLVSSNILRQLQAFSLDCAMSYELQKVISQECPNLEKAAFQGSELSWNFFTTLFSNCPLLENFSISLCKYFNDEILHNLISTHPNMRSLAVDNCPVSVFGQFLIGRYCKWIRHVAVRPSIPPEKFCSMEDFFWNSGQWFKTMPHGGSCWNDITFGVYSIYAQCTHLQHKVDGIPACLQEPEKTCDNFNLKSGL